MVVGTTTEHEASIRWVDVCDISDLIPNSGVCALVADEQVAIFYLTDEKAIYAIQNFDPIGKANVLSRGVVGDIKGNIVVASPLYKQHFNLLTGECLEKDEVRIKTFPVRVSGPTVQIGTVGTGVS